MAITRLLIANRGEIACRIIDSAKARGLYTIAVYSDADRQARHVQLADQAVYLGGARASESYLNVDKLLQAAQQTRADAIHPGYGFLSENAAFAQAVQDAGLAFVGPPASAIALMGDKGQAKQTLAAAGVPCLPGYQSDDQGDAALLAAARQLGYPLMVKAAAGGGGKGMRLVQQADQLAGALQAARSEAQSAFGNASLILERALINPRHVEVQVFADPQGHCVYLGDRDCSVQRRHQKIIEEAPAPGLTDATRRAMGEAAVAVARACDYVGAGTVEFLLDQDQQFYFLEMNTRLQVEHPVTEAIYGIDLVDWQLRIADGEPLPLAQESLIARGHAIEVRLCAEDPEQDFLPQTGSVLRWDAQPLPHCRIDHGLLVGGQISNHYDPLLAKIIAHGADRHTAIHRLLAQIDQTPLLGIKHNLGYLRRLLAHPAFQRAELGTAFLDRPDLGAAPADTGLQLVAASALWFASQHPGASWYQALSATSQPFNQCWQLEGDTHLLRIDARQWRHQRLTIHCQQQDFVVDVQNAGPSFALTIDQQRWSGAWHRIHDGLWLQSRGQSLLLRQPELITAAEDKPQGDQVAAPMDGLVVAICITDGQWVKAGAPLLVLEAMKMELPIKAPCDGHFSLLCLLHAQVNQGAPLARRLGEPPGLN